MEIVVGTYEELILGYRLIENEKGFSLEQSFTDHSHSGGVKTLAVSKKGVLASGSSDETIRLINLKQRKELGSLLQHEGSVTCIQYYSSGSHMFTSSEDGTVCVWKTGSWECSRILRGHKSAVYSVSVHPSGKLALSVGKDKTLRTWNLITAKTAYITNIKQVADLVLWSPDGTTYTVVCNSKADIYSVESAGICQSVQCEFRISCAVFLEDDILALGGDEGKIDIYSMKTKELLHTLETKTNRVKGMTCWKCSESGKLTLATVSSDSYIKIWHIDLTEKSVDCKLLTEVNTKFRLTCVAVWHKTEQTGQQRDNTDTETSRKQALSSPDQDSENSDSDQQDTEDDPSVQKGKKKKKRQLDDGEEKTLSSKKTKSASSSSDPPESQNRKKKRKQKMNRNKP